jgi:hypothetical protein
MLRNMRIYTIREYAYVEQAGRMGHGKMLLLEGQAAIAIGARAASPRESPPHSLRRVPGC